METSDPISRFRFRHALTRDSVLAELLPPERVSLAARGLRAVIAAHPGLPGKWCKLAVELAEQAEGLTGAAGLHLESGRRAFGRDALASAETNLERARHLADDDPRLAVDVDEALCEWMVRTGTPRIRDVCLSTIPSEDSSSARSTRVRGCMAAVLRGPLTSRPRPSSGCRERDSNPHVLTDRRF